MATVMPSKPATFRLPQWVHEFLERMADEEQASKTDVVVQAVACLREREVAALMAEGYREMAEDSLATAEASLPASVETLPEW
jgi:predicted transcriptional regulator